VIVLAIDTCGATGSIALGRLEGGAVTLLAQTELAGKTYSAQLVPAVRVLLADQNVDIGALSATVVVNGPGSFTGVRIGVSSAKGLAEALAVPLLAVSRLAVLAWKAGAEQAALDAGRGEF
jgi:tRNA threonylcarbamoyladenosine biosynthesis protein TsaB